MNEKRFNSLVEFLDEVSKDIGAEFHLVGGFVRDRIIGRDSKDIDVLSRGLGEDDLINGLRRHGKVERTGAVFGVIRFFPNNRDFPMIEIALPRKEMSTGDGHKDFVVEFDHTLSVKEDLLRRDFTINAIALRVPDLQVTDPYGGVRDIERMQLRMVSPTSAQDDPLRILRGIRFVSQLGFYFELGTAKQISDNAHLLTTISAERVQEELIKLVAGNHAAGGLRIAQKLGALKAILPELEEAVGCTQNKYHDLDVWEHTLAVLQNTPTDDPYVKLAALFHDIAKPFVKWVGEDGEPHFYGHPDHPHSAPHELRGEDMTRAIMERLRFSKAHTDHVCFLVREHMFQQGANLGKKAARKNLARWAKANGDLEKNVRDLFDLREGDCRGKRSPFDENAEKAVKLNRDFEQAVLRELEGDNAFKVTDLAVNGHDLMAVGLKGQQIGYTLGNLLDLVLEDPDLNDRDKLMEIVQSELVTQ